MNLRRLPLLFLSILISSPAFSQQAIDWFLPIDIEGRQSWKSVRLTPIGKFGALRKARPNIQAHLHTGIDIIRPSNNYENEPVFPAAKGKVISLRDDGPFAQIIIEHNQGNQKATWTVYEHVADIKVSIGDTVDPYYPVARFMNKEELDQYGWQFDHLHFEILKIMPYPLEPKRETPYRFFGTYWLECLNRADLNHYYHNPKNFFESLWGSY